MTTQEIERRLCAWQRASQACIHAGKLPGGPWSLRIVGHCALTGTEVRVAVLGSDETFASAIEALYQDERITAVLTNPRIELLLTNS